MRKSYKRERGYRRDWQRRGKRDDSGGCRDRREKEKAMRRSMRRQELLMLGQRDTSHSDSCFPASASCRTPPLSPAHLSGQSASRNKSCTTHCTLPFAPAPPDPPRACPAPASCCSRRSAGRSDAMLGRRLAVALRSLGGRERASGMPGHAGCRLAGCDTHHQLEDRGFRTLTHRPPFHIAHKAASHCLL